MNNFKNYSALTTPQKAQYRDAIIKGFPAVNQSSPMGKKYWDRLENYFSDFQFFLISPKEEVLGFINTIAFYFPDSLDKLPATGWDWMLGKGIADFENNVAPNYLGGLQVIVRRKYQGNGLSKDILKYAKRFYKDAGLSGLIIPIRPTKKYRFPDLPMETYLNLKEENRIYDPWIRTHIHSGAKIIKVCKKSMTITGDLSFWEELLGHKIKDSGAYVIRGALTEVSIDVKNNSGVYLEPNIWIKYQ